MGLMPAYFTTTVSRSRKSKNKQPTEHDRWLMKQGLHPDQIKKKKVVDKKWVSGYKENLKVERGSYVSAGMSGSSDSTAKRDMMSNLHKEPEHVRKEILAKASRVMPLFNKGGLQYATPETDMTTVGSKSRRG